MIAYPSMLVNAAKEASISTPENPEDFDPEEYPHFHAFCVMQLGRPLPHWGVVWNNAEVIAEYGDDEILKVTPGEILTNGFQ